jgi:hypothetical protein
VKLPRCAHRRLAKQSGLHAEVCVESLGPGAAPGRFEFKCGVGEESGEATCCLEGGLDGEAG